MWDVQEVESLPRNWHGYIVTVTKDESLMSDRIDLYKCILIDKFKDYCYKNDKLVFDHVEFIVKEHKANVKTVELKFHLREHD